MHATFTRGSHSGDAGDGWGLTAFKRVPDEGKEGSRMRLCERKVCKGDSGVKGRDGKGWGVKGEDGE